MVTLSTIWGNEYQKLSEEEAENWARSITIEQLLDFIILYDYVEHAEPEITMPDYTAIIVDDDVVVFSEDSAVFKLGHLEYELIIPETTFEGLVPKTDCHKVKTFLIGFGIGVVVSTAAIITVYSVLRR